MVRTGPEDRVSIEIAGGPPDALATIQIAGATLCRVQLDACGAGRAEVPRSDASGPIEIKVDGRVLLSGHIPAEGGA